MTDLDAAVTDAERRLQAAQYAQARAQAAFDAATAHAEQARKVLADTYGISTVARAQEVIADLEQQLAARLTELTAALDDAESPS